MLVIEGAIITTDAIGCQRDIAQKVLDKNADYILALKGNQGTLREDVELFASEQKANGFSDTKITQHKTVDGDHGRIETRTYTVIHDVAWLQERHQWPGLQGVVMVESERQILGQSPQTDKFERETRFYIHHFIAVDRRPTRAGCPSPLDGRERPALGHGCDFPRRPMPHPHRSRPSQLHHHQTHGPQPNPESPGKGFPPTPPQSRRLG